MMKQNFIHPATVPLLTWQDQRAVTKVAAMSAYRRRMKQLGRTVLPATRANGVVVGQR